MQYLTFNRVNACAIARYQKRINRKRPQQMAHLKHMTTRGKRQRDITIMQALQRAQGFIP
ncbi:hypothetical protein D3C78_1473280 [compost metagenome]